MTRNPRDPKADAEGVCDGECAADGQGDEPGHHAKGDVHAPARGAHRIGGGLDVVEDDLLTACEVHGVQDTRAVKIPADVRKVGRSTFASDIVLPMVITVSPSTMSRSHPRTVVDNGQGETLAVTSVPPPTPVADPGRARER
ncbi:hypothetical protein AB0N77_10700 [Streptomyces misionensis]|uniref:hypothetical protein n=1 Tax=Streptomyces TaxID=1883 RepID=UPI00344ABFE1